VIAATEIASPPADVPGPDRIALVSLPESVAVVVAVAGPLPAAGDPITVRWDGRRFVGGDGPGPAADAGRGEGDVPVAGRSRRPFEPPR